MFIYKITNTVNGKIYVGQHIGSDLDQYLLSQFWAVDRGDRSKPRLYNAMRKYGRDAFRIEPLIIVGSQWELNYYEALLIEKLDSRNPQIGYNIALGGDGGFTGNGWKHKPETLENFHLSRMGSGNPFFGKHHTAESIQRIKASKLGHKHSAETKMKMTQSQKLRWEARKNDSDYARAS
jgi:group I intron endonuclease